MPNAKTHLVVGAATGFVIDTFVQLERMRANPAVRFNWAELGFCALAAGTAALLPDVLEPATTPNHRKFCHSIAMAVIVTYAVTGKHTKRLAVAELTILTVLGAGYLSHLVADATTPRCISVF